MKQPHASSLLFRTAIAAASSLLCTLVAQAQSTWDGGGAPDGNFSVAANWAGDTVPDTSVAATVNFDGGAQLMATNDLTFITGSDNTINFNATAGAFTLWGNSIRVGGVNNNSSVMQAINIDLRVNGTRTFNVGTAGIWLGRPVGSTGSGGRTVTKSGAGDLIVTGNANAAGGGASYNVTAGGLIVSNAPGETLGFSGGGVSLAASGTSLQLRNAGTLNMGGTITAASGTTVILNNTGTATITNGATISAGANLIGVGNLEGGTLSILGGVAPGNSGIGTISAASLTLDAGATTTMEIERAAGQNADLLSTTGSLTLGGTLQVNNIGGALQAGDIFNLFDGTLAGSFGATNLPSLDPSLTWDVSQLNSQGILSVVPVPEPATLALLGAGALVLLRRRKV